MCCEVLGWGSGVLGRNAVGGGGVGVVTQAKVL